MNLKREDQIAQVTQGLNMVHEKAGNYFEACQKAAKEMGLNEAMSVQITAMLPFAVLIASDSDRSEASPEDIFVGYSVQMMDLVKLLRVVKQAHEEQCEDCSEETVQ